MPIQHIARRMLRSLCVCLLAAVGISGLAMASDLPASKPVPDSVRKQLRHKAAGPRTFAGTIVRDGDRFILVDSHGGIYRLDDSTRAEPFEGKAVNVTGGLDEGGPLIHVFWIEPDWA